RYFESGRYSKLRPNTQRNHRLMLEDVCRTGKSLSFAKITTTDITAGMVRRAHTPRVAAAYVSVMRALFDFAKASGWVSSNPVTSDVKASQERTDGYHTWTIEEVDRYRERHPVGTQARLALDIFLYTGLRRSDAIRLGKQHIKGNVIQ